MSRTTASLTPTPRPGEWGAPRVWAPGRGKGGGCRANLAEKRDELAKKP